MKVKILSGNQAGAVVDMEQVEAETAIATGFGEKYVEPGPEPEAEPEEKKAPARRR